MEEKCLNKFVKLFDRFTAVALLVANKVSDNIANPLTGINVLTDDLIRCWQIYEDHEDCNILYTALKEVKQNLWGLSVDNRILYLKSIIKKFADISIYTNKNYILCVEDAGTGTCSKKGSACQYMHVLQIQEFLKDTLPFQEQTSAQQYISSCAETLYRFEYELGRICKDFEINFAKLQEDLGIYLRKHIGIEENFSYIKRIISTEASSISPIGALTVEQTQKLFNLVNCSVFENANIGDFVRHFSFTASTLCICKRGKAKAIILFYELDSIYGPENIEYIRKKILDSFNPSFETYYIKHSGASEYGKLSSKFKKELKAIFQ